MSTDNQLHSELSRDLNLFHITMMGLGMMIGAGVFIGIGNCIEKVGPGGLVLTFALNGLIALFTCMSFAELSSAIPRAGGVYNFARLGFGKGTSFIAGWMEWFASSVAGSLYAVTFATYTIEFFVQIGWLNIAPDQKFLFVKLIALLVALLFIYINYRGSSETGKIGAFFTLGQMAFVWAIAVLGIIAVVKDPERVANFEPFMPEGWGRLLVTMGFIYVAFEGFEVIAQAGDETIDPKKNIPRAMLLSVLVVTITYVVVSFATVVSVHPHSAELAGKEPWQWIGQFKDTGFGQAVGMLMPSRAVGALVCFLAVLFSSTSALNATIYSATRASYALGRDNMLPPVFAFISAARKTPWVALLFTGVIVISVATLLPTKQVASCASIMFLFLFFLVNLCVIRIRYNMGDELQYGFLMPLFPVLPILAIICQGILVAFMHEMGAVALIIAPLWVLAGFVFYMLYGKHKSLPADHDIQILDEEVDTAAQKSAGYRVMVSVANPANALSLIRNTYRICRANENPSLDILHMVPVPDQVPLSQAHEFMNSGREAIMETMMYFTGDITANSTLRYCRHIPRGIIDAAREKGVKLLIMGWHGRRRRRGYVFGSTIDPVLERCPCDVAVMKNCGDQNYDRVLVPVAGGRNAGKALEMAFILAEPDAVIKVIYVDNGYRPPLDLKAFVDKVAADSGRVDLSRVETEVVSSTNVAGAILNEAVEHDLLVLGASGQKIWESFVKLALPERIALKYEKPLVVVKASSRVESIFKRWF